MRLISCHDGKLHELDAGPLAAGGGKLGAATRAATGFATGLDAFDALAPGGAFARGAVHEILVVDPSDAPPLLPAVLLARAAVGRREGFSCLVWCDPRGELYAPALAAHGVPLERVFLLRSTKADGAACTPTWAVAECLRCKGVGAVVAAPPRLSRTEARRLQLSAERGGGVGLLLRAMLPAREGKDGAKVRAPPEHAAATRWLVRPAPGERTVQRWSVQLIHGHGGRVGQLVYLEHHRETNLVRAVEQLADRPVQAGRGGRRGARAIA